MTKYIALTIITIPTLIALIFMLSFLGKEATIFGILAYLLIKDIKHEVEE